ncbi:MAG: hypothetical protein SGARI_002075 [Bacillariaceae sp.]
MAAAVEIITANLWVERCSSSRKETHTTELALHIQAAELTADMQVITAAADSIQSSDRRLHDSNALMEIPTTDTVTPTPMLAHIPRAQPRVANPYDQPLNPLGGGGLPASHARGASPQQQHYRGGNTYAGGGGGSVAGSMGSRSSNAASGRILTGLDRSSPFAFSGGAQRAQRAGYGRNGY